MYEKMLCMKMVWVNGILRKICHLNLSEAKQIKKRENRLIKLRFKLFVSKVVVVNCTDKLFKKKNR